MNNHPRPQQPGRGGGGGHDNDDGDGDQQQRPENISIIDHGREDGPGEQEEQEGQQEVGRVKKRRRVTVTHYSSSPPGRMEGGREGGTGEPKHRHYTTVLEEISRRVRLRMLDRGTRRHYVDHVLAGTQDILEEDREFQLTVGGEVVPDTEKLLDDPSFFDEFEDHFDMDKKKAYPNWLGVILYLVSNASDRLKDDKDFVRKMYEKACCYTPVIFRPIDVQPSSVVYGCQRAQMDGSGCHNIFYLASDRLKYDPDFILSTMFDKYDMEGALPYASASLRDDREFLLWIQERVLNTTDPPYHRLVKVPDLPLSAQHFNDYLRLNRSTLVVKWASKRLRDDKDFIWKICTLTGHITFDLYSKRRQNDKAFILQLVQRFGDGKELQDLSRKFRDDDDVVKACIRAWTDSLQAKRSRSYLVDVTYLDEEPDEDDETDRTKDKESAFSHDDTISPLGLASERLRNDKDVVMSTLKFDPSSIEHASLGLRGNTTFALSALRALRTCFQYPSQSENKQDLGVYSDARRMFLSFPVSMTTDGAFLSKALKQYPLFFYSDLPSHHSWQGREDFPLLISIALGSADDPDDFWLQYYGRRYYHEELVVFWRDAPLCHGVRGQVERLQNLLFPSGFNDTECLSNGLDRTKRKATRYDGFTTDGMFRLNDWKSRQWERLWLIDRVFAKTINSNSATATAQSRRLPTDVLKRIIGFAGIDHLLRHTSHVERFEPLFSKLLERNLFFPVEERGPKRGIILIS